jgi:hypothetical protein
VTNIHWSILQTFDALCLRFLDVTRWSLRPLLNYKYLSLSSLILGINKSWLLFQLPVDHCGNSKLKIFWSTELVLLWHFLEWSPFCKFYDSTDVRNLSYASGIQTVFHRTPWFHERLPGFPQAHFLYDETGKCNFDTFRLHFLFFLPFLSIPTLDSFSV